MNEAIRNLALLVWALSAVNSNVHAQAVTSYTIEEEAAPSAPVVVFGRANLGKNKSDSVLIEQNNEDNPLGNPLNTDTDTSAATPTTNNQPTATSAAAHPVITENLPQNPQLSPSESPPQVNKQIQDTLYESGNRIYDIQSFPAQDIKTIETPNLNPTITTYPAD